MKAYFDSIEKEVPEQLQQVFLNRRDTAVITIDMHDGHLSTDPDCPCPSPRGREITDRNRKHHAPRRRKQFFVCAALTQR